MRTIYKYPIEITDSQTLEISEDHKFLSVQVQNDKPCIWALVDTETPESPVNIHIYGTGHPIPKDLSMTYIGTIQVYDGRGVFHVFMEESKSIPKNRTICR